MEKASSEEIENEPVREEAGTSRPQQDEMRINIEEFMTLHEHMELEKGTTVIMPGAHVTPSEREPRIISFGPYYRNNWRFQSMESLKFRYLTSFLARGDLTVGKCIEEVLKLKDRLKESYGGDFNFSSQEFVAMIVLDSCFIIEYILRMHHEQPQDTLFYSKYRDSKYEKLIIEHDMLLLRNQLPFFVLKAIFSLTRDHISFSALIQKFFNQSSFIQINISQEPRSFDEAEHLLHSYHQYLLSGRPLPDTSSEDIPKDVFSISSATVLASAGVKFKKKECFSPLEISFNEGNMEIPSFFIDGFTESIIKNLIALEIFNPQIEPEFTAYVKFLDHIINTSEDVAILRKMHILDHALGSDKEVASLINSIGGSTFHYQPDHWKRIYIAVHGHCNVKLHKWKASLMRDYFNNPWLFIKVMAAVILLLLTFLQTFIGIYSYFHPRA